MERPNSKLTMPIVLGVGCLATVIAATVIVFQFRGRSMPDYVANPPEEDPYLLGDVAHGQELFFSEKLACAQCHQVGKNGGQAGPNLSVVSKQRTSQEIQRSIIDPSRFIQLGYLMYEVTDKEGNTIRGVGHREVKPELVLQQRDGQAITLQRSEIEIVSKEPLEAMPRDYPERMTLREFVDLMAFMLLLK